MTITKDIVNSDVTDSQKLSESAMSRAGSPRPVPSRSLLIRDIQILATLDAGLGDIRDAAIYVEGNAITWVGASANIPKDITADETINLPDRVLIPGLVNTHHHMFQCLTRCVAQVCSIFPATSTFLSPCSPAPSALQDEKLFTWLATCYGPWQHMTVSFCSSCHNMLEQPLLVVQM